VVAFLVMTEDTKRTAKVRMKFSGRAIGIRDEDE
jgi:hypothetical protein